ncbi:MAG: lipoprotein [Proteobacteria bacterium]|nr:lipoprotein [Pseudomonadota bacterium]
MSRIVPLSLVLVLGLGLSACGKRGPLEPPPAAHPSSAAERAEAKAAAKAKEEQEGTTASGTTDPARTKLGGKKRVPITAPKRDLFIDGILE